MYEIKRNPNSYLEHLQYVNRVKRSQQLNELKRKEDIVRREQGFQLHFNGANVPRVIEHRKREEKDKTNSPSLRKKCTENGERVRKRWGEPTVPPLLQPYPTKTSVNPRVTQPSLENRPGIISQNRSRRSSLSHGEARPEEPKMSVPIDLPELPEISKPTPHSLLAAPSMPSKRPKSSAGILLLAGSCILRPQTSKKKINEISQLVDRIERLNFEKRKKILNLLFKLENENYEVLRNDDESKEE
jgi:hypothetical protein